MHIDSRDRLFYQIIAFFILLLSCTVLKAHEEDETREGKLKAAFIYRFLYFTTWEEEVFKSGTEPLRIGLVGLEHHNASSYLSLKEFTYEERPIDVIEIESEEDLQQCHVIYFKHDHIQYDELIKAAKGYKHILLIGEGESFLNKGGMVRFLTEDDRLAFDVDLHAVENSQFRFKSKLLRLARKVVRK